jgi:carboxymethylenebutenolidase
MTGHYETISTPDGDFRAYVAFAATPKAPAVVVIQEIFGVNKVMRDITDDLAAQGYLAICPDLFWRIEPEIDITDQSKAEWDRAFELFNACDVAKAVEDIGRTVDYVRQHERCTGKVGAMGFCLGGLLAFLTAVRTSADAAVSYYGVGIDNVVGEAAGLQTPLMLHIAEEDGFVPKPAQAAIIAALKDSPNVVIHTYPGRDHAFARPGGAHYDAGDANLANSRSVSFLQQHLG